jgi:hypothetical protein
MYITKSCCQRDGLGRGRLSSIGLGDDTVPDAKAIQAEYGGMSKEAPTVGMGIKLAATVALMFIPVVGWAAAIAINLPVIGDAVMGPIMKPIMGMMKKATHMESCMKWWSDSNIRGMMAGMSPYPISAEVRHEYLLQRGKEMVVNESGRWENMASKFVRSVRANPNLMEAQCVSMPQGKAEMPNDINPALVASYFSQLKEQARNDEYMEIAGGYAITAGQKVAAVQETRQAASMFQLPTGVVGVKHGALVLDPKISTNKVITMFTNQR